MVSETSANVSGSGVPKPSSMNRLSSLTASSSFRASSDVVDQVDERLFRHPVAVVVHREGLEARNVCLNRNARGVGIVSVRNQLSKRRGRFAVDTVGDTREDAFIGSQLGARGFSGFDRTRDMFDEFLVVVGRSVAHQVPLAATLVADPRRGAA